MNEQFEAGKLTPVIDGSYTLDAREAFRHFGAGKDQGTVVITISPVRNARCDKTTTHS